MEIRAFVIIVAVNMVFGLFPPNIMADFSNIDQSPYTFGPQGRTVQDLTDFQKPNQMMNIVPNRPIAAKDKYGTRQYFMPNGKMVVSVARDGTTTVNLNTMSYEYDTDGLLSKITKISKDGNIKEYRDGSGKLLGWEELGPGGVTMKEYNEDNELTKTYKYYEFGKQIDYIMDEINETRTVFNRRGLPDYDLNYEGGVVARYYHGSEGSLVYKTDEQLNRTYYSPTGEMDRTEDQFGNALVRYYYKTDSNGRVVLSTSVDVYKRTTYYEKGKPQYELDENGKLAKEYFYADKVLQYTFEHTTGETTWFNKDGQPTSSMFGTESGKEWYYLNNKLVGMWDGTKNQLIAYIRGDEVGRYLLFNKPTLDGIKEMIDSGEIKKRYD